MNFHINYAYELRGGSRGGTLSFATFKLCLLNDEVKVNGFGEIIHILGRKVAELFGISFMRFVVVDDEFNGLRIFLA